MWERIAFTYGITFISFAIGIAAIYVLSDASKKERKKQIDYVITILIHFVLYIWLSKILLRIQVVFNDPIAVIAFPSDSRSFYLAHIWIAVHQWFKRQALPTLFIPIILASSFVYEFIQVVFFEQHYKFYYVIMLGVLLIGFLLLKYKCDLSHLVKIISFVWTSGIFLFSTMYPLFTIYGFIIDSTYAGALLIVTVIWMFRKKEYIG